MGKLLILGAGGFGRQVFELAREAGEFEAIAFLDDNSQDPRVVGRLGDYLALKGAYTHALAAIGNNPLRLEWGEKLKEVGYILPTLCHPAAYVSPSAQIGEGSVVLPLACLMASVKVGRCCIVNTGSVADHDSRLEDGCHLGVKAIVKAGATLPSLTKLDAGEILRSPWEYQK